MKKNNHIEANIMLLTEKLISKQESGAFGMSIILVISFVIQLLFYVAIIGIGVFIQVKLSNNNNKYLGLILPGAAFAIAVLITLGVASFTVSTATITDVVVVSEVNEQPEKIIDESERNIEDSEEILEVREIDSDVSGFLRLSLIFLVTNIPTIIFAGIYVSERNKLTTRKAIEK